MSDSGLLPHYITYVRHRLERWWELDNEDHGLLTKQIGFVLSQPQAVQLPTFQPVLSETLDFLTRIDKTNLVQQVAQHIMAADRTWLRNYLVKFDDEASQSIVIDRGPKEPGDDSDELE